MSGRFDSSVNGRMNGFSAKQLFRLVCCPPWPPKIAEKIAFKPPLSTYSFSNDPKEKLSIRILDSETSLNMKVQENIDCFFATTTRGNKIALVHLKCNDEAKYTILFSHGNASDIGLMFPFYQDLCNEVRCNILAYDYSGYGMSSGRPSEKNMYSDIECAWDILTSWFKVPPENIILYGQSLGTVPTVDLASRRNPGAVILHSPLTSALRVVYPDIKRTWCCDTLRTIEKVQKISSPVLVIHGDRDETVPFSHGVAVFERCPHRVDPLWVVGAGHNTVELHGEYMERLKTFVTKDLENICKSEVKQEKE